MIKATGTWIVLEDPREKLPESSIKLLDSTKNDMLQEAESVEGNILTILSVGERVLDSKIVEGKKAVLDPRMPLAILAIDDIQEEFVLVAQENQIMGVL
jgi:hypothetical protein